MSEFKVEITKAGEGPNCPVGAKVTAHYHGTLTNGKVFDSSVNRGQPFQFTCGVGQVIKGWDQGFQQLNKGAKAKITCPPSYAYGNHAVGGGLIPANSTLIFEVELIDFK